ncbi:uncharacterized protein ASCRUDRAFT_126993 [Ascoidea rubescens DSM 1968]|uniref:Uncharacterized protein n=1 Tax=Ascoidea rubescens DSM 1968 TaxID=1344418 RepID=A0A1D2VN91_9ASCO|nr:hypothetical protein ASCRUDRAFT_126993 [Ascoidea rubescens DSM 1968]ODV63078.1 hypothetical protein ASCRUDRAFT_126993 [Ascoidea rubescens DSM 1968]
MRSLPPQRVSKRRAIGRFLLSVILSILNWENKMELLINTNQEQNNMGSCALYQTKYHSIRARLRRRLRKHLQSVVPCSRSKMVQLMLRLGLDLVRPQWSSFYGQESRFGG